jgi:hypothetical protein
VNDDVALIIDVTVVAPTCSSLLSTPTETLFKRRECEKNGKHEAMVNGDGKNFAVAAFTAHGAPSAKSFARLARITAHVDPKTRAVIIAMIQRAVAISTGMCIHNADAQRSFAPESPLYERQYLPPAVRPALAANPHVVADQLAIAPSAAPAAAPAPSAAGDEGGEAAADYPPDQRVVSAGRQPGTALRGSWPTTLPRSLDARTSTMRRSMLVNIRPAAARRRRRASAERAGAADQLPVRRTTAHARVRGKRPRLHVA